MTKNKKQKVIATETVYTDEDLKAVSDTPEITAEQFAQAKTFAEAFPVLAEKIRRSREP